MEKQRFEINRPGIYNYEVIMDELNSQKELLGVIKAEEVGDYEINIVSRHVVGETNCRVDVKGIVSGGARVKVKGTVRIDKGATGSDSFLAMKLLMLDDISMAVAEPELEIENNEVKASHSASVGRIDEEQLFYLESRGVEKKQAEKLIISGFLGEVE
ncbi:hypothetical protein A2572_03120 [Candidatus Collierbacteria bacterium RIFOXYD1_FULL_40_9]|uniref:SUF system FeS cluster assembly SufBD core domain-containing protein n=1 Tax=Candidatus Collierbacteria bacterium RIFOXYD1_FULL_40_9 TaxID=1817731 RepID=A0A1F5FX06_9BACT|nr:MAG: hypothetical protein A2572_03120 [Candidatus Collierbacteria bacterium RIFOXYD1_FULL_40_9]